MPFFNRQKIAPELRRQYETQYRNQLRQALTDPTITAERRQAIREQLAMIGRPKVYDPDSSPKPDAVPNNGVQQ